MTFLNIIQVTVRDKWLLHPHLDVLWVILHDWRPNKLQELWEIFGQRDLIKCYLLEDTGELT